jgi:hypothetical protein
MDAWLGETFGLFLNFFGRETSTETHVVIVLCILLGALALSRVGTNLGALGAFFITGVLITALGLALIFAAMALPSAFTYFPFWVSLILAVLALLGIVIPLTVWFHKGGYVTALIAWTVALLTIGTVLTLEPIAMRSVQKGLALSVTRVHQVEGHRIQTEKLQ